MQLVFYFVSNTYPKIFTDRFESNYFSEWIGWKHLIWLCPKMNSKVGVCMANTICQLILVLFACTAYAEPFLVCDPPDDSEYALIEYYEVDGLPESIVATNIQKDETREYGFKLDIAGLPITGNWHLVARACSSTLGCSENSKPLDYWKSIRIGSPSSISGTIQ